MGTLLQSISDFIDNISVTDRQEENIEISFGNLKRQLTKDNSGLSIKEVFLNGSYERDTIIRPLDDVDLFAVIDESDYCKGGIDPKPQTVLTNFKNYLNGLNDYKDKVKQDRPCVTVVLSDKNFDVLPSLKKSGSLYIPNEALDGWIFTDPKTQSLNLNDVNRIRSYKVKNVVKAVKHWKRENKHNIPSFHVEEVAINIFNLYGFTNYEEGIRLWFNHAESYLCSAKFKSYDEYDKFKLRVISVKNKLNNAKLLNDDNKAAEAMKIWKDVFGMKFPVLDKEEAKSFSQALSNGVLKHNPVNGLSKANGISFTASKGFYGEIH